MSDIWTQSEGQVMTIDSGFANILEAADDSAVFLTQLDNRNLKERPSNSSAGPNADLQPLIWRRVSSSTSKFARIFETRRWRLQNRDRLYVVMEYAEKTFTDSPPAVSHRIRCSRYARPVLMRSFFSTAKPRSFADQTFQHSRHRRSAKAFYRRSLPIGESRKSSSSSMFTTPPETAASPLTLPRTSGLWA